MPTSKKTRGNKKRSTRRAKSTKVAAGVAFGDKAKFIRRFPRNTKAKWLMAEYLKETGSTMSENHVYAVHKEMKAEEKSAGPDTTTGEASTPTTEAAPAEGAKATGGTAKKVTARKAAKETGRTAGRNSSVARGNGHKEAEDEKQKYFELFDSSVLGIGIVEAEARLAQLKREVFRVKTA